MGWFGEYGRDLGWGERRDGYGMWVREMMVEERGMGEGWEYWEGLMKRYGKVEELGGGREDDVLKVWEGLGY